MSTPLTTIQAVRCEKCQKLHPVESTAYLTIEGRIVRRRGDSRRMLQEHPQHLGTEAKPTVLCDNDSCLIEFIRPNN